MENNINKGRPTSYHSEYTEQAYKLCLLGATDEQLADFFEVSRVTIDHWKHAYPLFQDAIRRGKLTADSAIAESLFKSAQGYELTETTEKDIDGHVESVTTKKKYPPNITAAIFWLKNRQKQTWNDKYKTEQTNEPVFTSTMAPVKMIKTKEELDIFEAAKKLGYVPENTVVILSPYIGREQELIEE